MPSRAIRAHLDGCPDCLEAFDFQAELKVMIAAAVPPGRRCRPALLATDRDAASTARSRRPVTLAGHAESRSPPRSGTGGSASCCSPCRCWPSLGARRRLPQERHGDALPEPAPARRQLTERACSTSCSPAAPSRPPASPVVCAFSGGPTRRPCSRWPSHAGWSSTAVHVDHGLRPTSGAEAEQAVAIAAELGVAVPRGAPSSSPHGPNLEARARDGPPRGPAAAGALTGHTADDRAETVLINLLRGAGPTGWRRSAPDRTRPLLALRRAETRALCAALGLDPVDDPSNADPRFVRNRVRHELLPLLDDIAGRDVVAAPRPHGRPRPRRRLELLDELARDLDPTDARALVAAPPPTPAGPCAAGWPATVTRPMRQRRPRCWPSPAVAAGPASSPAGGGSNGTTSGCASSTPAAVVSTSGMGTSGIR